MKFLLWLSFHYGCIYVFSLVYFGLESNMVGTCVVYGCTNRQEKGGNISFFHFPHKNPPVLKQWANAVNRLHWFPKHHSLICSVHFKESCFIVRPGKRGRLLKDGAVPTEFPTHPSHLQHQTRKRKSPKKRDIQEPLIFMTYQFCHTYFGTIKKTSHFKALLHFCHALYDTGIVLIVFVSLRAFI